jgi:hypothetical protein
MLTNIKPQSADDFVDLTDQLEVVKKATLDIEHRNGHEVVPFIVVLQIDGVEAANGAASDRIPYSDKLTFRIVFDRYIADRLGCSDARTLLKRSYQRHRGRANTAPAGESQGDQLGPR